MGRLEADVGAERWPPRYCFRSVPVNLVNSPSFERSVPVPRPGCHGTDMIRDGGVMAAMMLSNKLEIARE